MVKSRAWHYHQRPGAGAVNEIASFPATCPPPSLPFFSRRVEPLCLRPCLHGDAGCCHGGRSGQTPGLPTVALGRPTGFRRLALHNLDPPPPYPKKKLMPEIALRVALRVQVADLDDGAPQSKYFQGPKITKSPACQAVWGPNPHDYCHPFGTPFGAELFEGVFFIKVFNASRYSLCVCLCV